MRVLVSKLDMQIFSFQIIMHFLDSKLDMHVLVSILDNTRFSFQIRYAFFCFQIKNAMF